MSDPLQEARRLSEEIRRLFPVGPANNYEGSTARVIHDFAAAYDALAHRVEDAEEALRRIEPMQQRALAKIEANGFVFEDIGREPGNWQHLAFSLYTDLCEVDSITRDALDAASEEKGE